MTQPFSEESILEENHLMRKVVFILTILYTFTGCTDPDRDEDLLGVSIRISNISEYDFKNIVVDTSTGIRAFEDIDSGEATNYQVFELAYRYAYIELEIDGETFTIQPIDYVGEAPLANRLYTYQLDANDSQEQYGRLSLTLVED